MLTTVRSTRKATHPDSSVNAIPTATCRTSFSNTNYIIINLLLYFLSLSSFVSPKTEHNAPFRVQLQGSKISEWVAIVVPTVLCNGHMVLGGVFGCVCACILCMCVLLVLYMPN